MSGEGENMKPEEVLLDVIQEEGSERRSPRARLVARSYPADRRGFIYLTPECTTIDHFEQAVAQLLERLEALVQEARAAFKQSQAEEEMAVKELHTVEEVWHAMEKGATLEAMQVVFNPMDPGKRREVANFIFSQLNIFKGPASTFSQHYNEEECLLE
jgi:hypothetical protein